MQSYRQYGPLDDVSEIVGDFGFNQLDMLTDVAMLPSATLAISENLRFDVNGTVVRGGCARQFPPGTAIGTIFRSGVYKPDQGDDQFAFLTSNKLVIFAPATQTMTAYNYPAGETIGVGDKVDIIQAGIGTGTLPTLYLLRGLDQDVLVFDGGAGTVTTASGFPPAEFALFYGDRIAANVTTQSVGVSDFLDFTNFVTLNQFQINKGGDDYLTAFLPYQNDYVLVGSRKSWSLAFFDPTVSSGGYTGNLVDTSFLRQQTLEAGPVGPRACIEALGKIWFITDGAIYAFTPQLDGTLVVLGKPISAQIQPIMNLMSAKYSRNAAIARWGYRLYFALPVNDTSVAIITISVEVKTITGLTLPFNLPTSLTTGSIATVTTVAPHGLIADDTVLLTGISTSGLNGEFTVLTVIDDLNFTVATNTGANVMLGTHATSQKVATRNNRIAVFNLNNMGWESIDSLPAGFYADELLVADFGTRRRLWLVDQTLGPTLYEELDADETGTVLGGVTLPFTLPVNLSAANYGTVNIPGRFVTRAFRWGNQAFASVDRSDGYPRKVKGCEVRSTLDADSMLTLTLMARTPNNTLWQGTRSFVASQFETADAPLRKMSGQRALEAQVEVNVTAGRPNFRSVMIETVNVGKVEE